MAFENGEINFHIYSIQMIKNKSVLSYKGNSLKRKLSKTDFYKTFA